ALWLLSACATGATVAQSQTRNALNASDGRIAERPEQSPANVQNPEQSPANVQNNDPAPQVEPAGGGAVKSSDNGDALAALWDARVARTEPVDPPLGPGDQIDISVPGMKELSEVKVRVSGTGSIELPVIGIVQAAGLSEQALEAELQQRLSKYMRHPDLRLFVSDYRSRDVGVFGAVAKPGLYSVASNSDTINDLLSQAGGMTTQAAPRIQFVAARAGATTTAGAPAAGAGTFGGSNAYEIDLRSQRGRRYFNLPVEPGDSIIVPELGEVLVTGWVNQPGSYKITPGLTVLGAIAAAGAPMWPADTSVVRVLRPDDNGETHQLVVNLDKIAKGDQADIKVRDADVVELDSSTAKEIPYGFYAFFRKVLNVGAGVPIAPGF
ncbi:MAG: polysaccharide biosynthesis/export family protein, partial [Candidatus Binataceae bacterium]